MVQFIMSVGLPASGKTYYAHNLENFQVFSSDDIRNELFPNGDGYSKENQAVVFRVLGNRVRASLMAGENTFYDATNMNRKKRMEFLKTLKDINCLKSCYLFAEPLDVCKIRNKFREAYVPDDVYDRMIRSFCVPVMREGWDEIERICEYPTSIMRIHEVSKELSQHNSWHTLSIGDHAEKAVNLLRKDPRFLELLPEEKTLLVEATRFHDIGKVYAASKFNACRMEDGNWHYYGHEHIGSYMVLTDGNINKCLGLEVLGLALMIELHMRPFNYYKDGSRAEKRDRELFGDWIVDSVKMIHDADVAAH